MCGKLVQATLQYSSLRAGPRQFLPLIGSGLLHSLRRSFVPSPQSPSRTSQRDQDDQSDHPPFAEKLCYEIFFESRDVYDYPTNRIVRNSKTFV